MLGKDENVADIGLVPSFQVYLFFDLASALARFVLLHLDHQLSSVFIPKQKGYKIHFAQRTLTEPLLTWFAQLSFAS